MSEKLSLIFPKDKVTDMGNGYVVADTQLTPEEMIEAIIRYSGSDGDLAVVKKNDGVENEV